MAFLSTPSARRATGHFGFLLLFFGISIHALREEGDHQRWAPRASGGGISIHTLREEGDVEPVILGVIGFLFLSTPSVRRATHDLVGRPAESQISIHALREEGDAAQLQSCRSSHGFLSTPSARRATRLQIASL